MPNAYTAAWIHAQRETVDAGQHSTARSKPSAKAQAAQPPDSRAAVQCYLLESKPVIAIVLVTTVYVF